MHPTTIVTILLGSNKSWCSEPVPLIAFLANYPRIEQCKHTCLSAFTECGPSKISCTNSTTIQFPPFCLSVFFSLWLMTKYALQLRPHRQASGGVQRDQSLRTMPTLLDVIRDQGVCKKGYISGGLCIISRQKGDMLLRAFIHHPFK